MTEDILYMKRCLQLAEKGLGQVAPNPLVGAVLVYQGRIIGEGYHQQFGQAHAEVNCLASVAEADRQWIPEATMYVNLEPCAHFGKTPPCAHRLVQERVARVVVCNIDPFEQVAGKGIQLLRAAGIQVDTGVLADKGAWLNRRFFTFHQQQRPYVILKWAQTQNGLFAPKDRSRFQMTDEYSLRLSHQWRREEAAIMVGYNTAMQDNPQLICRYGEGVQPLRILLDKDLRIPSTHHLLAQHFPTWLVNQLVDKTVDHLRYVQLDFSVPLLPQLLQELYKAQQLSLIVEGGATLMQHFIDQGLWDEARIFTTPNCLSEGIAAPLLQQHKLVFEHPLRQDLLHIYRPATATII
jgi:diaminohydroxyphosphoribosylaminopyrimidine deaminase/5-amino-6-(5-phosphoribosylamino)uracil reductase